MMRHAYLIEVHSNFRILNSLIEFLDDDNNDFFILIDKKVKEPFKELVTVHPKFSKIYEIPRIKISWASYSGICAVFELLKAAISTGGYSYLHFMQGADFPIKRKSEIADFFEKNNGKEFIHFDPTWYEFGKYKVNPHHFLVNNRFYRRWKILRCISLGIAHIEKFFGYHRWNETIYSGSAIWTITETFAEFLLDHEKFIKKKCKYTLAADEVVWQTLIMNTSFKNQIYHFEKNDGNLYFIDFAADKREGNSPYTFMASDVQQLLTLPDSYLYARKFNEKRDYQVIEKLIEALKE